MRDRVVPKPNCLGNDVIVATSHDLILRQATMDIGIHRVARARCDVLDKAEAQGTSTILVALELGDCSLRSIGRVESDNASAARSTTRLILDLSLLDLADSGEEFNQVIVACRPRQL